MRFPTRFVASWPLLLAACAGDAAAPTEEGGATAARVARLVFAADSVAVNQGREAQVVATALDAQGNAVPGATIAYSVSDDRVAMVSGGGAVTGLRSGVATVRASVAGATATATLEVFGHPEGRLVGAESLGGRPFGVAVSRDGVVYVTQLDASALARLDTTRRVVGAVSVGHTPTGVAFSPTGDLAFVTNQSSGTVAVVDVAKGTSVADVRVPAAPFVPFVSPDGRKLFVTTNTSRVYVADSRTRALVDSITLTHAPNGFALDPDERRIYVSAFFGGSVHEIDVATNAVLRAFMPGGVPQGMTVSPDGRELFVANEAGWLDVYALGTGERTARIALGGGGFGVALSPDQEHLYVSLPNAGRVQVVNTSSLRIAHTIEVGGVPRRIAFTRHGGVAVIPNEAGYVSFVR